MEVEWMDERTAGLIDIHIGKSTDGWMNWLEQELIVVHWIFIWTAGWIDDELMDKEYMDGWNNTRMDEWTDQ